jgi:DNA polymerase-3 subunit delta
VSEEDVRALVARAREANIFRLVDAVAEGQVTVALQALELLRSEGETPPRLISMIARQFRMIVIAREVLDGGGAAAQVREVLKVQEFVARRAVDQARRFSQSTADAAMRRILQCDVEIQDYWQARPGGVQQDLAVELLVADLCGVRAPAAAAH